MFIDGQDVRGLRQETLRDASGLVPQEVVLFNASMKKNLLYGRPDASDEELRDAAQRACWNSSTGCRKAGRRVWASAA